jgi:signal transduction histidine kinase
MRGSERTRHVPIIFVTAGARDQHRLFKGYEAGAVDFLYKPIDPHILRNKAEVFFQLHRQKRLLAQQLRERTETLRLNEIFTAALGHDLRNPLNAILTAAEVLRHTAPNETVTEMAARMLSSGRRMSRMIADMLDLARARVGGGLSVKRAASDLASVVDHVVQEHRDTDPEGEVEVVLAGDLAGEWDADRLLQLASNLVGNALQHGERSEPVRVEADGTDAAVVTLCVTNVGRLPDELVPRLFDPFQGRQRDAGREGGLGLGLYIVQQIVHAHGGTIEVDPGHGQRVCFRVRTPRRAAAAKGEIRRSGSDTDLREIGV